MKSVWLVELKNHKGRWVQVWGFATKRRALADAERWARAGRMSRVRKIGGPS